LLDKGADIASTNNFGNTALHEAARQNRNIQIAQLLIERGADVKAVNKMATSVVECSHQNINEDIKQLLLATAGTSSLTGVSRKRKISTNCVPGKKRSLVSVNPSSCTLS
jgi:ankyrin repeat protein